MRASVAPLLLPLLVLSCVHVRPASAGTHLLWHQCAGHEYWTPIYDALKEAIHFDSVNCVDGNEGTLLSSILASEAGDPKKIVVIASPLKDAANAKDILANKGAMIFVEEAPDVEALNLTRNATRSYAMKPDNSEGGRMAGSVFCNMARLPQQMVLLRADGKSAGNALHDDARIEGFLDGVNKNCGDAGHKVLATADAGWSTEKAEEVMTQLFITMPSITAVFAANDGMARGAVMAAEKTRRGGTDGLLIGGYDHTKEIREEFKKGNIFVSIDQLVSYPSDGMIYTITKLLPVLRGSSSDGKPPEGLPFVINTPVAPYVPNMPAFISRNVMSNYLSTVKPPGEVRVATGLREVSFTSIDDTNGLVEVTAEIVASWKDPRLAWDSRLHNSTIDFVSKSVWSPQLYFRNEYDGDTLLAPPAIVSSDGTVNWRQKVRVKGLCGFNLAMFPFDRSSCALSLVSSYAATAGGGGVTLDNSLGFKIDNLPASFELKTSTDVANEDGFSVAHFRITAERRPFSYALRMIVPGLLLNIVGFMAFLIPEPSDSVALSVTVLLCLLAMRDSINLPETSQMTWAELFMLINTTYQGLVMFMSGIDFQPFLKAKVDSSVLSVRDASTKTLMRIRSFGEKPPAHAEEKEGAIDFTHDLRDVEERNASTDEKVSGGDADKMEFSGADLFGCIFVVPSYLILMIIMLVDNGKHVESFLRSQ